MQMCYKSCDCDCLKSNVHQRQVLSESEFGYIFSVRIVIKITCFLITDLTHGYA